MSLLNKALRKKGMEREHSTEIGALYKSTTISKKGKTKIYAIVLIVVFISLIGVFGFLKFFYLPGPAMIQPRMIAQRQEPQKTTPPSDAQNSRIVSDPVPEGKKKTIQEIPAVEKQKPQTPPKGPPEVEFKKDLNSTLTTMSVVKPKKKDAIHLKKTTRPSIDHDTLDLYFQKALVYHRQNRMDEAIKMYQEVLLKNPKHEEALFNLASVYVEMSDFSKAYPMIKKLDHMNPENPQILLNLAIVKIGLGKPRSALDSLTEAERQNSAPLFEIYFHRSVALSQLGHLNKAMKWYKRAEELRSYHPRLMFNMAVLYDKIHNYQEAIRYYSSYLKLNLEATPEKKEIESRLVTLKAYLVKQSKNAIKKTP